jgi:hypothetical protein
VADHDEKVDILKPPTFEKSGHAKLRGEAIENGDWIGSFNLWIVQDSPVPSIVYQQRGPTRTWMPNKLDVTAGGRYRAGEEIADGLREIREELGKDYEFKDLTYLGRKINVSPDTKSRLNHTVIDIFMVLDNSPFVSYKIDPEEIYAVCSCPIDDLIKAHTETGYSFTVKGLKHDGTETDIYVDKNSFPYNWDNYHFKIALLAKQFLAGDKNLLY